MGELQVRQGRRRRPFAPAAQPPSMASAPCPAPAPPRRPLQGNIAIAGNTPTPQFMRRFAGYVEQFDTLLDTLTVQEMLM